MAWILLQVFPAVCGIRWFEPREQHADGSSGVVGAGQRRQTKKSLTCTFAAGTRSWSLFFRYVCTIGLFHHVSPIYWGFKTFMFHGFGVQGHVLCNDSPKWRSLRSLNPRFQVTTCGWNNKVTTWRTWSVVIICKSIFCQGPSTKV